MRPAVLLIMAIITIHSFAQRTERIEESISESISDCPGAVNILQSGNYSLQFTGKPGVLNDLAAYPSLNGIPEKNSVWCSFKATYTGRLSLTADAAMGTLQMIVFENESKNVCDDIAKGRAEIRRLVKSDNGHVGLDLVTQKNVLYSLDIPAGKYVMLCFLGEAKGKSKFELYVNFESADGNAKKVDETKVIDIRRVKTDPALNIQIRDVETGEAITANLTVTGFKKPIALSGSDFFMPAERSGKIKLKVDAQGYFFVDREEPVTAGSDNEIIVWMEPLSEGKSMQLDEIEFVPGSSDFLPTAEPKLRRLKDFLALNATVKVEIQGHVHAVGENSYASQKMSEARAKRVLNYLVENGIDKSRLTSVGYGNTVPVYPKAKFAYEEQANRRVEILVK